MSKFQKTFTKYEFENYGYILLPEVKFSKEELKSIGCKKNDNKEILRRLCFNGYRKWLDSGLIDKASPEKYIERCKSEIQTLLTLSFVDYILLIYKQCKFCWDNNILMSPGRGSCAGSLIAALIGITYGIDPIKDNLLFERFISAARAKTKVINGKTWIDAGSLPDIDCDVDYLQREFIIREFWEKNYPERTCQLGTFNTLTSKVLAKEVVKAYLEYSEDDSKFVANTIEKNFGKVEKIETALESNIDFQKWTKENSENMEATKLMCGLQNLIKNTSLHPSAVFICNEKVSDVLPLQLSSEKKITTCFDMSDACDFGIKGDLLGLKTLSTCRDTLNQVDKNITDIDINDPEIYGFLSNREEFYGLFQIETGTLGADTVSKIKPDNIHDVMMVLALGRPGCLKFINDYCKYKHEGIIKDTHERIKDILESTGGNLVFQEQLMFLSSRMANFTPIETDGIRKAVGKKIKEKMLSYKETFIDGSIKNNFTKDFSEKIWSTFEDSADYSFNASHAKSYAHLTAITTALKVHHPHEYFISLLKMAKHEPKPTECFRMICSELPKFGIKLLPPHLLKSKEEFSKEESNIRYPLSSIKGISDQTLKKLKQFVGDYNNKFSLFLAAKQSGLSIGHMSAIILAGALDDYRTETRSRLSLECQIFSLLTDKEKLYCLNNSEKYNYNLISMLPNINDWVDTAGKKISRKTRLNTIRKNSHKYIAIFKQNEKYDELCSWIMENELLGFSYSKSLKNIFLKYGPDILDLQEFSNLQKGQSGLVVAQIQESFISKSKKGNKMAKLIIGDESIAEFRTYLCGKSFVNFFEDEKQELPQKGEIVAIKLIKTDSNTGFVEKIKNQNVKICIKYSDLKDQEIDQTEDILPRTTEEKPKEPAQFELKF